MASECASSRAISLCLTVTRTVRQTFTVKNTGKTKKTFKVAHIPAGTALTIQPDSIFPADGPVPISAAAAVVKVQPQTFTVSPGFSQTVSVSITPPSGIDPALFPVFSGFLELANGDERYQVSYLGMGASLKDMTVIDDTDFFFGVPIPALVDAEGNLLDGPANFTFVDNDFPSVVMRLNFGTPVLRFDLVDSNIHFTPTISARAEQEDSHVFVRSTFTFPFGPSSGTFAKVKTVGTLFEADWQPRNSDVDVRSPFSLGLCYPIYNTDSTINTQDGTGFNELTFPTPTFANGTTIPNGSYRILLRALKVTGDVKKEEDYESWLSPVIGVQVPA